MDKKQKLDMFQKMVMIRNIEELGTAHKKSGDIPGPLHCCIGQEAIGVGVGTALRQSDFITSTHRPVGHFIGKGGDLNKLMYEFFGKEKGCSHGRGGHFFLNDPVNGILGGTGVVGSMIGVAVGYALAFNIQGKDNVALTFFSDGASNTGMCHEAMNMASVWKLPVIFFCENNQWALTVNNKESLSYTNIADRAKGYNIPSIIIDGNNVLEVYDKTSQVLAKVRSGEGPFLIEAKTYRQCGFSTSDVGGYQPEKELAYWKKRDPIILFEELLLKENLVDKDEIEKIKSDIVKQVESAIELAMKSSYPDPSGVLDYLYA